MKISSSASIVGLPQEAPLAVDDNYLTEMTDRLHKLRALLKDQNKPVAKKRKARAS